MKLETIKTNTVETFIQAGDTSISVYAWGNCEGASIMIHGSGLAQKMACSLRWEEIDALIVALAAARVRRLR
jgi:hypothetical protein